METIKNDGVKAFVVSAPIVAADGTVRPGRLGLLQSKLLEIAQRGEARMIAAFYGHVMQDMDATQHIFRGLQRSMQSDTNDKADQAILVYSRKPWTDYDWVGDKFNGDLGQVAAPEGCVFVVLVPPNEVLRGDFPTIDGWIVGWNWIDEDNVLPGAPVDWVDRYEDRIWTQKIGGSL